jgi:hypothetical protein
LTAESHVVTVSLDFGDGTIEIHELFRGDRAECRNLAGRISGASDDRRRLRASHVCLSSIADWEAYMSV